MERFRFAASLRLKDKKRIKAKRPPAPSGAEVSSICAMLAVGSVKDKHCSDMRNRFIKSGTFARQIV